MNTASDEYKSEVEGSLAWYAKAFDACEFDAGYESAVANDCAVILKHLDHYKDMEATTKVPWFVWGLTDLKEGGCNPLAIYHNGERIVGTDKKTSIVPKGRGPFATKKESGLDAFKDSWMLLKSFTLEEILKTAEKYNGLGYISGAGRQETSPYIWARSNINDGAGKYVSDGKFDPSAPTNKTSGFATMLKWFEKNGHVQLQRMSVVNNLPQSPVPPPTPQVSSGFFGAPWIGFFIPRIGWFETTHDKDLSQYWPLVHLNYSTVVGVSHAWCAMIMQAALNSVGIKGEGSASAGAWRDYGDQSDYVFGAILPILHASGGHHITCFLYWVDEANKIAACLGGNQSNAIRVSIYNLSGHKLGHDEVINGPRWPKGVPPGQKVSKVDVNGLLTTSVVSVGGSTV